MESELKRTVDLCLRQSRYRRRKGASAPARDRMPMEIQPNIFHNGKAVPVAIALVLCPAGGLIDAPADYLFERGSPDQARRGKAWDSIELAGDPNGGNACADPGDVGNAGLSVPFTAEIVRPAAIATHLEKASTGQAGAPLGDSPGSFDESAARMLLWRRPRSSPPRAFKNKSGVRARAAGNAGLEPGGQRISRSKRFCQGHRHEWEGPPFLVWIKPGIGRG